jgi:hypothetical protein
VATVIGVIASHRKEILKYIICRFREEHAVL